MTVPFRRVRRVGLRARTRFVKTSPPQGGHSVVVDAVFGRSDERRILEELAAARGVPFVGVWLDAPHPVLIARTEQRRNAPSDADANVVRLHCEQGAGAVTWCRVDGARPAAAVLTSVLERVRDVVPDAMNAVGPDAR